MLKNDLKPTTREERERLRDAIVDSLYHETNIPTPEQIDELLEARQGAYVASASIPERGAMWRQLRDEGYQINSTWIDEDGEGQTGDFSELWSRIASEIQYSERLILYADPDDFPLKGALIEVGMALGFGVPVLVVAPYVRLEPRSCRPLGSWINHPLVRRIDTVEQALLIRLEALGLPANHAEGLALLVEEMGKVLRAADAEIKAGVVRDASRRYDGGSGHGRSVGHDETVSLHEAAKGRREAIDGFRSGPCGVWLEESDKKR